MVGLIIAAIISVVAGVIAFLWVDGIDYMHTNHPDYRGEDLFNEEEK
jgi:hypothetical protein